MSLQLMRITSHDWYIFMLLLRLNCDSNLLIDSILYHVILFDIVSVNSFSLFFSFFSIFNLQFWYKWYEQKNRTWNTYQYFDDFTKLANQLIFSSIWCYLPWPYNSYAAPHPAWCAGQRKSRKPSRNILAYMYVIFTFLSYPSPYICAASINHSSRQSFIYLLYVFSIYLIWYWSHLLYFQIF
jgi:hypothetical protein